MDTVSIVVDSLVVLANLTLLVALIWRWKK